MEELSLGTLLAVFEEMFGFGVFRAMVGVAVLVAILFVVQVVRDGGIKAVRFSRAELLAPIGGAAAVAFVWIMTNSDLRDIGGPVDMLVLVGVFTAGAFGAVLLGYLAGGLLARYRA
jgi:hypothetical protein